MTEIPQPDADPIRWLLGISHHLPPVEVPAAVAWAGTLLGAEETTLYLVDYAQQLLVPFLAPGAPPKRPIAIEGSVAGSAFRAERPCRSTTKGPSGPEETVWLPLVDGADRLGVVGVMFRTQVADLTELTHVATVAAALVVSKGKYTDTIGLVRGQDALDVAAEFRWALMPPLTYAGSGITIAGGLEPAYEIAGDCFDYSVNGDVVHVALLDAMGHGLEASLMANLALATYRQSRRLGRSFEDAYLEIDRLLDEQFGNFRFVTGVFATLDLVDGELEVFSAGHPPPLIVCEGEVASVECRPSQPMGLRGGAGEVGTARITPGDTVVFFTDGMIEARAPDGTQFGSERLVAELGAGDRHEATSETVRRTLRAVVDHAAGNLRDDATVLLARWEGPDRGW